MKFNRILTFFLAFGLIASCILAFQRFDLESYYKNYEVDFYYADLEKLAQQEHRSMDQYLDMMKDTGVMNMIIREETIQSMKQSPNYEVETELVGYDLVIRSEDEALIQWVFEGYQDTQKAERNVILEDANTVRVLGESYEQITAPVLTLGNYGQRNITAQVWESSMLETVGLGYDKQAIQKAKAHGYGVILVPTYNPDFQSPERAVQRYLDALDEHELRPSHIFFTGLNVIGYDPRGGTDEKGRMPALVTLAKELEDRGIALGFIESSSQGGYLETKGMLELAHLMDYDATGNYLTWDFIQSKFDFGIPGHHQGEEITNIFFRGITTRNIRIIALKPFVKADRYIAEPSAYEKVLSDLQKRLSVHGVKPGPLRTMAYHAPNPILQAIVAIGVGAAALLALDNLMRVPKRVLYGLLALGILGVGAVYGALPSLQGIATKVFALLGAMVMPIMALLLLSFHLRRIYRQKEQKSVWISGRNAIGMMLLFMLVSFGSVLFEIALLSHSKYLLGLDAFSGVKFSQMIPMLMAPVVYVAYNGYKRGYKSSEVGIKAEDAERFLNDSIKIWQVLLLGAAAAVLLVFMMRSGNTSGTPSIFEVLLRNTLEVVFPARPRTKAIFVGLPALILSLYHAYRGRFESSAWVWMFVSSIAFVNMVNTFSHMKAPIYLSVYRTGAELLVGALVAFILILVEEGIVGYRNRRMRHE